MRMIEPFILTGEIDATVANDFFTLAAAELITDLVISSPGGDIGLTLGMFDVVRIQGINTHVVGLAQSAAAVLFQAGKKRMMTANSLLLFHAPDEHADDAERRLHARLVEMVHERTGGTFPKRTTCSTTNSSIPIGRSKSGLLMRVQPF